MESLLCLIQNIQLPYLFVYQWLESFLYPLSSFPILFLLYQHLNFFSGFYAGLLRVVPRTTACVHPHWTCHYQIFGHYLDTFCPSLCYELCFFCVCGWVGVCALIDRCAIPFQLCCSLTHLTLHYAAFMLFLGCKLHFWEEEKWPTVPVIMLNSVRMRKCGGKDKWSEIKFLNIRQMIC